VCAIETVRARVRNLKIVQHPRDRSGSIIDASATRLDADDARIDAHIERTIVCFTRAVRETA